ncbi:MAG: hypothetical protein U0Y10_06350 [Spirosomataceae bacterium]
MVEQLQKNYATVGVSLLFLVLALPLVALSWYNVPSAADDFCFALNTIKFGFWQGQRYYYDGWTGRYFSTLLMHANPLVWGWLGWYKVFPLLMLGGLSHSLYRLVVQLTPCTPTQAWVATSGLLFLYLFQAPSLVEVFFWLPSVAGYTVAMILLNYFVVALAKASQAKPSVLEIVWMSFLIFAIVGLNETPMLALFVLLGAMAGLTFLRIWRLPWFWWILLGVLVVSVYLELSAPGNRVRMSYNPVSGQLIPSVISSVQDTLMAIADWLIHTPLLFFTALFIPLALQWLGGSHRVLAVHPILSVGLWLGILALGIFPGYYGVGIPPPPRTMNLVYWFFLLGWFFNVLVLLSFIRSKRRLQPAPLPFYIQVFLGTWALVMLVQSENIRPLYGDLLKGRAKQYYAEMTTRYQRIETEKNLPLVEVDSLVTRPKMLFTEDITANPKHLWNTCQAEYWGVKALKIKEKPN